MRRSILVAVLVILAGCGSGSPSSPAGVAPTSEPAVVAPAPIPGNAVALVTVNADFRQGDPSGEYLVDVTFRTTAGDEYHVDYCDTPIEAGDLVRTEDDGEGTTLIFVNEVLVGNVIDWAATEAAIDRVIAERRASE